MATQSKQVTSSLAACVEKNYYLGSEIKFDLDKNEAAHCEGVLAARRDDTFAFFHADVFKKLFSFGLSHKLNAENETHAEMSYDLASVGDSANKFSVALTHELRYARDLDFKVKGTFTDDLVCEVATVWRWNEKTRVVLADSVSARAAPDIFSSNHWRF